MSPRLVLGHCFFSRDDVELASLIPNIKDPELDALESVFPLKKGDYTVSKVDDFSAFLRSQKNDRAQAFLTQIANFTSRRSRQAKTQLKAHSGYIYTLRKPSTWFRRLCQRSVVREWLQEQIEDGNAVYFVVGLHTLFDAATVSGTRLASQHSGQVSLPITELSGWSLGGNPMDVGISAGSWKNKDSSSRCTAPGEKIFAIRVKRVIFRFWEPHDVDNARLGKNSRWKLASDNRSATEDDSEVVEAFLEDEDADADVDDDDDDDENDHEDGHSDGYDLNWDVDLRVLGDYDDYDRISSQSETEDMQASLHGGSSETHARDRDDNGQS